jgi:hypothetical protein
MPRGFSTSMTRLLERLLVFTWSTGRAARMRRAPPSDVALPTPESKFPAAVRNVRSLRSYYRLHRVTTASSSRALSLEVVTNFITSEFVTFPKEHYHHFTTGRTLGTRLPISKPIAALGRGSIQTLLLKSGDRALAVALRFIHAR